jgi:hypothetical protein
MHVRRRNAVQMYLYRRSWIYVTKFKNNTAFEAAMSQPTEEQVRARTHELWTEAGNPAGRSDEFWHIRPNKNRGTRTSHRLCGRRTQIAGRVPSISPVLREKPHPTNCHLSRHCGAETNSKRLREGPRLSPKPTVQIQSRSANHCNDTAGLIAHLNVVLHIRTAGDGLEERSFA